MTKRTEQNLHVHSLLSSRTHQGVVALTVNGHETQMSPEKARLVAGFLLEAAEAADTDAMLHAWLAGMDMDDAAIMAGLSQFRVLRDVKRAAEYERDPPKDRVRARGGLVMETYRPEWDDKRDSAAWWSSYRDARREVGLPAEFPDARNGHAVLRWWRWDGCADALAPALVALVAALLVLWSCLHG